MDREEFEQSGLDFLRVELETGNTFIAIAQKAAEDQEKADRNRANAARHTIRFCALCPI